MVTTEIDRKIKAARLALAWESLWAALCWPLIILMALVAVTLSGVLIWVPDIIRFSVLLVGVAAIAWTARHVLQIRWPNTHDAMRRVETTSNLANRPVSTSRDTLAPASWSEESHALWEEHRLRQLGHLKNLKAGFPRSSWRDIDVIALRVPVTMALVATLFLVPGDEFSNLANSMRVGAATPSKSISFDAWLKPPVYTGKPPLLLTSPAEIEKLKADSEILTAENAGLTLRLDGARAPRIAFYDLAGDKPAELPDLKAKTKFENGLYEAEARLTRPALIKVYDGNTELAAWHVSIIPDQPPAIALQGEPKTGSMGTLALKWKATDDYGMSGITAQIDLSDTQEDGLGFTGNGVFLFDPPKFPIALRKAAPKEETGTSSADLASHPWAGLMVDLTLEATDAAGQKTRTAVKTFKLPERYFTKPLAQSLIEQRKMLIRDPDQVPKVVKLLKALLIYPVGLIERSGTHLAIATVVSRLNNLHGPDDVVEAVNALWQIAVAIEDGDVGDARAAVEAARKALEKALAEGAPPEEIKQLMEKLRKSMDRYLEAMRKEAEKRQAQGQKDNAARDGKMISRQDIQKMLDDIEKLSQSGQKDKAQDMLAQLEELLKNMQPGMAQNGEQDQSGNQQMLDKLTDMMRKQQELMDKTLRQPQPGEGDQLNPEGDNPGNRSGNMGSEGLAGEQGDLARQLQQFMQELQNNGLQGPPSFGEAGRQMGDAQKSLEQQERDQALGQQGEALSQLREGARKLSREMQARGRNGQDNSGREGEARGDARDPLGRPTRTHEDDYGPDKNMLPSELAIRRAREILENLRARANRPDLPRIDRDYIERLLRGLY